MTVDDGQSIDQLVKQMGSERALVPPWRRSVSGTATQLGTAKLVWFDSAKRADHKVSKELYCQE